MFPTLLRPIQVDDTRPRRTQWADCPDRRGHHTRGQNIDRVTCHFKPRLLDSPVSVHHPEGLRAPLRRLRAVPPGG
jgi:hypothetical protein